MMRQIILSITTLGLSSMVLGQSIEVVLFQETGLEEATQTALTNYAEQTGVEMTFYEEVLDYSANPGNIQPCAVMDSILSQKDVAIFLGGTKPQHCNWADIVPQLHQFVEDGGTLIFQGPNADGGMAFFFEPEQWEQFDDSPWFGDIDDSQHWCCGLGVENANCGGGQELFGFSHIDHPIFSGAYNYPSGQQGICDMMIFEPSWYSLGAADLNDSRFFSILEFGQALNTDWVHEGEDTQMIFGKTIGTGHVVFYGENNPLPDPYTGSQTLLGNMVVHFSEESGCTDENACNYDPEANVDDGSCLELDACGECGGVGVAGCTASEACNYNPIASCDDGNCIHLPEIDLGEDVETCEDSVTLDAGPGYDSYLWSTGETTQTIHISTSGEYSLQVQSTQLENDVNWTLYHHESFDTVPGPEWNATEVLSYADNSILGKFGENAEVLGTYSDLPEHTQAMVEFDLYIIDSWDGNFGGVDGPDQWFFDIDQQEHINTTFANNPNANTNNVGQSYPGSGTSTFNPVQTGAAMLLAATEGPACCDCGYTTAVYHISQTINHNLDSITLLFADSLSQSLCDESWALDNVRVYFDAPSACASSDSISVVLNHGSCYCGDGSVWHEEIQECLPIVTSENACGDGTEWDVETQSCVIINPSDTNFDGCVSMTDLLDLLSVFGTCNEVPWSCGDPLEYQGYDYETVLIGEQCWFAENCRFMPFVGGGFQEEPSVLVYGYDGDSVEEAQETLTYDMYGALYNFASATQLGLCPQGWHVPSKIEFDELFANLGGIDQAHFQVMQEQAWNVDFDLADDGFSLLPAGWLYLSFAEVGESAYMWTSTPYGENDPRGYAWNIQELNQFQVVYEGASRAAGQSVRCIQDSE